MDGEGGMRRGGNEFPGLLYSPFARRPEAGWPAVGDLGVSLCALSAVNAGTLVCWRRWQLVAGYMYAPADVSVQLCMRGAPSIKVLDDADRYLGGRGSIPG